MKQKIRGWLWRLVPHIHNLDEVIYINWLGYEWIIAKVKIG